MSNALVMTNGVVSDDSIRRRESGEEMRILKPTTPMLAIRAKCVDCCGGSTKEVKLCTITGCPIFKYRMGHRPAKETK
jgi:hypothetical protein